VLVVNNAQGEEEVILRLLRQRTPLGASVPSRIVVVAELLLPGLLQRTWARTARSQGIPSYSGCGAMGGEHPFAKTWSGPLRLSSFCWQQAVVENFPE
jgi:hypothetical protein